MTKAAAVIAGVDPARISFLLSRCKCGNELVDVKLQAPNVIGQGTLVVAQNFLLLLANAVGLTLGLTLAWKTISALG